LQTALISTGLKYSPNLLDRGQLKFGDFGPHMSGALDYSNSPCDFQDANPFLCALSLLMIKETEEN
jgi:hypothetical protein